MRKSNTFFSKTSQIKQSVSSFNPTVGDNIKIKDLKGKRAAPACHRAALHNDKP